VAGTLVVHVDRSPGEGPGHIADAPGVIEVDVRHHHRRQVVGSQTKATQFGEQGGHRRLAARLHKYRGRTLDQVAGGDLLPPAEERVDLDDPRRDPHRGCPTPSVVWITSDTRWNPPSPGM